MIPIWTTFIASVFERLDWNHRPEESCTYIYFRILQDLHVTMKCFRGAPPTLMKGSHGPLFIEEQRTFVPIFICTNCLICTNRFLAKYALHCRHASPRSWSRVFNYSWSSKKKNAVPAGREKRFKGAITSKIKHAIKLKTSPATLAQLLQPSLAFCFSLQPMTAYRPGVIGCKLKQNANDGCDSCATVVLCFVACFILLVIAP